jgi:lysozyme family protein
MTSTFEQLKLGEHILGVEGGYTNHRSDRGGETIWGITHETARRYGFTRPMVQMTKEEALKIYEARYFKEPGLLLVSTVSPLLAKELFDVAVNMGVAWPGIFLQTALNKLNRRGKDYPNLKIDGDIGPSTIDKLKRFLSRRGVEGEKVLACAVVVQKGGRYFDITPEDDQNEDFFYGWLANRVAGRI